MTYPQSSSSRHAVRASLGRISLAGILASSLPTRKVMQNPSAELPVIRGMSDN
jgi:hypothetical protein